jgi:hypothetical protein
MLAPTINPLYTSWCAPPGVQSSNGGEGEVIVNSCNLSTPGARDPSPRNSPSLRGAPHKHTGGRAHTKTTRHIHIRGAAPWVNILK